MVGVSAAPPPILESGLLAGLRVNEPCPEVVFTATLTGYNV